VSESVWGERVDVVKKRARAGGVREVSPARRTAFEILRRVDEEGAFAAPLLAAPGEELSAGDRALCHELVLGVLRRQLWLDKILEHYAGREAASLDAPVRLALRLGLYQLRFLTRVPARAAVNESVNLAHAARLRSAAPFINAVLRRATRERDYDPTSVAHDIIGKISIETSHPAWLVERWASSFGVEEAYAFARANNQPAPVSFRINVLRADGAATIGCLREAGVEVLPSRVAPDAWRIAGAGGSSAMLRELSGEGLIYLQDEASQLIAHVVGARACERVLDVCAAPGSKTTHVAALALDGASVVACDLYEHRLRVVEESSARQGLQSIRTVILDAEAGLPFPCESFDRALVDAPCSGTGTLRHNPEIRWRIKPEDIESLAAKQRRILSQAARALRRGGRLVYSTCSVESEENEAIVAEFLQSHGDFRQVRVAPAPDAILTATGAGRTWPHRDNVDGFFVAALEKGS